MSDSILWWPAEALDEATAREAQRAKARVRRDQELRRSSAAGTQQGTKLAGRHNRAAAKRSWKREVWA